MGVLFVFGIEGRGKGMWQGISGLNKMFGLLGRRMYGMNLLGRWFEISEERGRRKMRSAAEVQSLNKLH